METNLEWKLSIKNYQRTILFWHTIRYIDKISNQILGSNLGRKKSKFSIVMYNSFEKSLMLQKNILGIPKVDSWNKFYRKRSTKTVLPVEISWKRAIFFSKNFKNILPASYRCFHVSPSVKFLKNLRVLRKNLSCMNESTASFASEPYFVY